MVSIDPARAASPEAHLARYRATGDPTAFGALFDSTAGPLFRVALTIVRDPVTAEDVLQQTFLIALKKLGRLPEGRPVMPWLVNVLTKEAAKAVRSRRRTPDPQRLARSAPVSTDASSAVGESEEAVRRAIDSLEEPYRSAALLRWRYGLEPAEVAHVRGEPPGTTRSILSRALERLRSMKVILPTAIFADAVGVRGLEHVRAELVRAAGVAAKAAAVGAVAGLALLSGGLVVKISAVLALLGGGYMAIRARPESEAIPISEVRAPILRLTSDRLDPEPNGHKAKGPAGSESAARSASALGVVRGRVVTADGRPVSEALAVLQLRNRSTLLEFDSQNPDPTSRTASTSPDGRFELDLPFRTNVSLVLIARGFASAVIDPIGPGPERTIVLRPSGAIHGHVMDVKARPIADAHVRLSVLAGAFHTIREAKSDASGAYRLDDAPSIGASGRTSSCLTVDAEGYARQFLDTRQELRRDVQAGEDVELNAVLSRGASVSGRVVEHGTGMPVAGAKVYLWTTDGSMGEIEHPAAPYLLGKSVTSADGRYRFESVPTKGFHDSRHGEMPSMVTGKPIGSWLGAGKPGFTTALNEVTLTEDGAALEVDLKLRPAFSIEGRVVDGEGTPVRHAQVWASMLREGVTGGIPAPLRSDLPMERASSGDDGSYRMDGVAIPPAADAAKGVTMGVGAASTLQTIGSDPADRVYAALDGPYEGVVHAPDLVLTARTYPWGQIRVLRPDGAPVVGADVGRSLPYPESMTDEHGVARVSWSYLVPSSSRMGDFAVYVRAPGFAVARVQVPLSSEASATPTEVVVRLARGHRLTGRVTAREGSLPASVKVTVGNGSLSLADAFPWAHRHERSEIANSPSPPFGEYGSFDVAADGSFVADDLPAGPYHVIARATRADLNVEPIFGETPIFAEQAGVPTGGTVALVLAISRAPVLQSFDVRVVDAATDEPVLRPSGAVIAIDGSRRLQGRRMAPGALRFEAVTLGNWLFYGGAEGYVSSASAIEIVVSEQGLSAPLVIRVSRGAKVSGTIVSADGTAFVGNVMLEPFDSAVRKIIGATRTAGRFEMSGVPPGRYRITGVTNIIKAATWVARADGALVEVAADVKEVRVEGDWVAGGTLEVWSNDRRFIGAGSNGMLTETQAKVARQCALTVTDSRGRVVAQRIGFGTDDQRVTITCAFPPGTYVARLTVPGEPVRESRGDVVAGKAAQVVLR